MNLAHRDPRDFEHQAASFDRRTGLPPAVCAEIAASVVRLTEVRPSDLLLELGTGTGQIAVALCRAHPRYLGIDSSAAMIAVCAQRAAHDGVEIPLQQADAARPWPVPDASVSVFFSSRTLHLLPLEPIVEEVARASAPSGATLIVGRIERDADGVRSRLRREKRRYVERVLGLEPAAGRERDRMLFEALLARGARHVDAVVAASWEEDESAAAVLDWWRTKSTLAGLELAPGLRDATMQHLSRWAVDTLGPLDRVQRAGYRYVLAGVEIPPRRSP